jgi:hypothetical protein
MTAFLNTKNPLDQLDHELRHVTREDGRVFNLSEFRRHLDAIQPGPPQDSARLADEHGASRGESQLRHELNLAFTDLGAAAFALAHHGRATDPRLATRVQHINQLYAQLDAITHAA